MGILWGGNIGALFPFVETVFRGQSLHDWIDREIAAAETKSAILRQQLTDRHQPDTPDAARARQQLQMRLRAEQTALSAYRRMRPVIVRYLPSQPFTTLVLVMMLVVVGTLVKGILLAISTVLTEHVTQAVTLRLRKQLFHRALEMELPTLDRLGQKELISRMTYDLEQVTVGLRTLFGRALHEPMKILACLIGAGFICWRLLLLSLVVAPLAAIMIGWLNRAIKMANRRTLDQMSQIYSVLGETFQSIRIVKAFVAERHERRRFDAVGRDLFRKSIQVARFDALVRPTVELLGISMICVAVLGGAYLVLHEQTQICGITVASRPLSASTALLFFSLLAGVTDPARKMSGVVGRLQRAAAATDRILELIHAQPRSIRGRGLVSLPRHKASIEFHDVSFSYADNHLVLDRISLHIAHGETIALVGPNGCGKTTLVALLLKFHEPSAGSIRIDGTDVRDVGTRDLRRQIGLVTQDPLLFNDTVAANIRYGNPAATMDQVRAAARRANAHDMILHDLRDGYETMVGEMGSRLSGGQRQRIALARAICADRPILILDEATSQIDRSSESEIHRILRDFITDRTTFIITHRTSVLELADRVVVMDHGRIIDCGTPGELAGRCAAYRGMAGGGAAKAA
jgi:ATP-binding cassette subfamily B protein/subfamily B ATP-binding cassette protein MsbA